MPHALQRIGVYCASNDGALPDYVSAASNFGRLLATRGYGVVYGGGLTGCMGALADGALEAGGEVTGVMPHALVEREVAHRGLTALHIVDSMHERKAMLADLSDAFVALPGGLGTLEEFFETWTGAQLGVHHKPLALLNVAGFWTPMLEVLAHVGRQGFLRGTPQDWLIVDDDPERVLAQLQAFVPPPTRRWLRPGET